PFGKGKRFAGGAGRALDLIIGGWQITDTTNVSSGLPWTANAGECNLTVDTGPCLPELIGSFKVGAGSLQHPANSQPVVPYFAPVTPMNFDFSSLTVGQDTCQLARPTSGPFQLSPCGTYGLVGRNSMRGPGAFFDDMSVQKNFHITERFNAQFRMDAFNVFNHPVLGFSSQDYAATGGTCIDCNQNASTGAYNGLIKDIQDGPNKGTTMRQLQFGLKLIF
ncbi:MAG: outer membrane beta-barrel protein, partial [Terriglobales bacterium]